MNIEITAAEIGMFVAFTIMTVGLVMAIKRRSMRKKKANTIADVEEYEFRSNPETLAPEKVPKEPEPAEKQVTDNDKQYDIDKLLDSLQDDKNTEK